MSEYAIKAEGVAKSYQTGETTLEVLREVSLSVKKGEFISIQGESGCGKTTLLNVLAGIESPDNGFVEWGGERIDALGRNALAVKRGKYLGIVFQSYYLVPEIDSLQNVLMSRRILGGESASRKSMRLARCWRRWAWAIDVTKCQIRYREESVSVSR